jgi:hypothetical protein
LSFETICTRQTRNVALVVHAVDGDTLPVLINGTEHATIDADGNAHLLLQVDRGERAVTVRVDLEKVISSWRKISEPSPSVRNACAGGSEDANPAPTTQ